MKTKYQLSISIENQKNSLDTSSQHQMSKMSFLTSSPATSSVSFLVSSPSRPPIRRAFLTLFWHLLPENRKNIEVLSLNLHIQSAHNKGCSFKKDLLYFWQYYDTFT